ncbi:MAG: exonuclease domain-containing protein [Pseudomonadales bacterium]
MKYSEMLWPFGQLPSHYVVLDTETTGLPDEQGITDLISVGLAVVQNYTVEASFEFLIRPTGPISEEAQKVHGITQARAQDFLSFDKEAAKFSETLTDELVVIHNASFDWPILLEHYNRYNLAIPKSRGVFCSQKSAFPWALANKIKCSERGPSLDTLSSLFNVESFREERGAHGAEIDALQTAEVVEHLRALSVASLAR